MWAWLRWLKASPSTKILVKWGRWQRRLAGAETRPLMDFRCIWNSELGVQHNGGPTKNWQYYQFWMKHHGKKDDPDLNREKMRKKRTTTMVLLRIHRHATCPITVLVKIKGFLTFWHSMCLRLVKVTGSLTRCEWHLKRSSSVKISFDSTTLGRLLMLPII